MRDEFVLIEATYLPAGHTPWSYDLNDEQVTRIEDIQANWFWVLPDGKSLCDVLTYEEPDYPVLNTDVVRFSAVVFPLIGCRTPDAESILWRLVDIDGYDETFQSDINDWKAIADQIRAKRSDAQQRIIVNFIAVYECGSFGMKPETTQWCNHLLVGWLDSRTFHPYPGNETLTLVNWPHILTRNQEPINE